MAVNVKTQDFEEQVAKASGPVLVDFWASWCGPCRMLAPVIDQLAAEQTDVKVCKVNIDEEPGLAQRFGVMSIPTVVLFENGQEKNRSGADGPPGAPESDWHGSILPESRRYGDGFHQYGLPRGSCCGLSMH